MKKININSAFYPHFSPLTTIVAPSLQAKQLSLQILREDLLHPQLSGNKYRKLKYNLLEAHAQQKNTLLTFGGAYSNHIAAVASAGQRFGFHTIGIIRGEQASSLSPTLQHAQAQGMQLHFISRSAYRQKEETSFLKQLRQELGDFYLIPEGGTNLLAIKGCQEIWSNINHHFSTPPDYICTCVGTGGTIAGLISGHATPTKILGFSALKGDFLTKEVSNLLLQIQPAPFHNWEIITDYHFGGYAKHKAPLIDFINQFKAIHHIPLDPVYTGKMLYGIFDLVEKDYFPKGSKIVAIHTGGLQGIEGFNQRFSNLLH